MSTKPTQPKAHSSTGVAAANSKPASIAKKVAPTAKKSSPVATKPVAAAAKPATKPPTVAAKVAVKPTVAKPKTATSKKPAKKAIKKDLKKARPEKVKMERDSFTMPKEEYAQITLLKARLTSMGQPAKKSELLRAGVKLLAAMSDNTLKTTLAKIPVIKTGRPNK